MKTDTQMTDQPRVLASDAGLRRKLIKLAHADPEMRPHLLPLLANTKQARATFHWKAEQLVISGPTRRGTETSGTISLKGFVSADMHVADVQNTAAQWIAKFADLRAQMHREVSVAGGTDFTAQPPTDSRTHPLTITAEAGMLVFKGEGMPFGWTGGPSDQEAHRLLSDVMKSLGIHS